MTDATQTENQETLAAGQAPRSTGPESILVPMTALDCIRLTDILAKAQRGRELSHAESLLATDLIDYISTVL